MAFRDYFPYCPLHFFNPFTSKARAEEEQATPVSSSSRPATPGEFSHPAMLKGTEAIDYLVKAYGMDAEDLRRGIALANKHNIIYGFRVPNPYVPSLLKEGLPAKGIEIKPKTSELGPIAGYIPLDQSLSKASTRTKEEIEDLNRKAQISVEEGLAFPTPLEVSGQRIRRLSEVGAVKIAAGEIGGTDLRLAARGHVRSEETFAIKEYDFGAELHRTAGGSANYRILLNDKPVPVLGKIEGGNSSDDADNSDNAGNAEEGNFASADNSPHKKGKAKADKEPNKIYPMTGDLDMLLFAIPIETYGPKDRSPLIPSPSKNLLVRSNTFHGETGRKNTAGFPVNSPMSEDTDYFGANATQRIERAASLDESASGLSPNPRNISPSAIFRRRSSGASKKPMVTNPGVISNRLEELLPDINEVFERDPDNPVVLHGPETHNPNPGPIDKDAVPSFTFYPSHIEEAESIIFSGTVSGLQSSFLIIKNNGFQFFGNPGWDKVLPKSQYRRGSYEIALHELGKTLRLDKPPLSRPTPPDSPVLEMKPYERHTPGAD